MTSKQLATLSKISGITAVVWVFGIGGLAWNGAFGDPDKPANPLMFILWLGPMIAGIVLAHNLLDRSKAKAIMEAQQDESKVQVEQQSPLLDASHESPEALEYAYRFLGTARLRVAGLRIGVLCLIFVFAIVLAIIAGSQPKQLAFTAFWAGLVSIVFFASAIIGLVVTFISLLRPLQSAETPEATCERFYRLVLSSGSLPVNYPAAYVCLLAMAKESIGGYNEFRRHWKETSSELVRRGISDGQSIALSITKTEGAMDSDNQIARTVTFSFKNGVEIHHFIDHVSFVRVGKRWYLASGRWGGVVSGQGQHLTLDESLS